ncbi:MAG TPA: class I SAM-dependent methyltransferase [Candidatus Acidoferrum sp.]|nr:class I SAM-dependent methyltransferase [Candidatus Acidoferrum sp.]
MRKQALYKELSKYYDLIYSFKDYKKESVRIKALVSKYKMSEGKELLDVACGTGQHLEYLKDEFSCMGIDISNEMLKVAMKNVDGVVFKQANMTTLSLGREFDVITCLFSSIGYVKTLANLRRTIRNFSKHLKNGGVVLIEPWFSKSTFYPGSPNMTTYDGKDIKIARLNVSELRGSLSVMDMHYLIAERGEDVKHLVDRHEMGLFDVDETLRIMKTNGLRSRFLKHRLMRERGMLVGVKKLL